MIKSLNNNVHLYELLRRTLGLGSTHRVSRGKPRRNWASTSSLCTRARRLCTCVVSCGYSEEGYPCRYGIHSLITQSYIQYTIHGAARRGGEGRGCSYTQLDRVNQIYIESSGFLLPLDNLIINNQMIYYLFVFYIIFNV